MTTDKIDRVETMEGSIGKTIQLVLFKYLSLFCEFSVTGRETKDSR